MISYEALIRAMKEKGVGKTELSRELGLSSRTVAKIAKGEKLSGRSMQKIADYLSLPAEILMREESSNRILQLLRDEKRMNLPGGLYHELQVRMTYNSNHMEGSRLTEAANYPKTRPDTYSKPTPWTLETAFPWMIFWKRFITSGPLIM